MENQFKYRLHELLLSKYQVDTKQGRRELATFIGVSSSTISLDFNIRSNEKDRTIPKARVIAYSKFFEIPETALLTAKVATV